MDIEFDTAKDLANRSIHGVSLAIGADIIPRALATVTDRRFDYGEVRINAFALIEGRLFMCTYTMRGAAYRIISARRASRKERERWLS